MWHLVGDIGGTNMRLAALSDDGTVLVQSKTPTTTTQAFHDALSDLRATQGCAPQKAAVAGAGVVSNGAIVLTNSGVGTRLAEADMDRVLGMSGARVINDFEAAAWSLATVSAAETTPLQGQTDFAPAPRMIIGPGTGLGVGALVWARDTPCIVSGEGGHVRLSPGNAQEVEVFRALIDDWPQIQMGEGLSLEAEGMVSGTGLPYLYRAVARVLDTPAQAITSAEIFGAAKARTDASAVLAVSMFARHLGALAGDLGMTFGATGGVFIAGGVATSNPWIFDADFIEAFNAGGRHRPWREAMPLYLYTSGDFGLRGAQNALIWA